MRAKKIPSWSHGLRGDIVVVKRWADTLERGIRSTVSIDGDDGVAHQLQRYNNLRANK